VFNRLTTSITGLASAGAGVALCVASYIESTLPAGCVGDQCDYRPQRPDSVSADTFYVLALAMLVLAAVGLGAIVLRRRGLGRTGAIAITLIVVGAVVAVVANVVQSVYFDGDLPVMPAIFLPAIAAMVVGFVVLVVVVVRARIVPVWAGVLVAVTLLLVPFGNQENSTVLLDIPLGLALIVAGVLVLRLPSDGPAAPRRLVTPR
jgi:hypothetical protein